MDAALRAADLHPNLVPEGVKLALVNLLKDRFGDEPALETYAPAAALFAYCVIGPDGFSHANGEAALDDAERRVDRALGGDGLDADIVLLAHHAKLLQPAVIARHGIEVD